MAVECVCLAQTGTYELHKVCTFYISLVPIFLLLCISSGAARCVCSAREADIHMQKWETHTEWIRRDVRHTLHTKTFCIHSAGHAWLLIMRRGGIDLGGERTLLRRTEGIPIRQASLGCADRYDPESANCAVFDQRALRRDASPANITVLSEQTL